MFNVYEEGGPTGKRLLGQCQDMETAIALADAEAKQERGPVCYIKVVRKDGTVLAVRECARIP